MNEPIHIISLGAGVQSSTMALMAADGCIQPMPKCAIFADTKSEPKEVYAWLRKLEKLLPFEVVRCTAGNLGRDILNSIADPKRHRVGQAPFFVSNGTEETALLWRKCTKEYKVAEIRRAVRKILKLHASKHAVQWIGISLDESLRMKESGVRYSSHRWPLIELRMTRYDCLRWLKQRGIPQPPKSACWFCPYTSDQVWRKRQMENPTLFRQAVAFDAKIRTGLPGVKSKAYLHRSLTPLSQVDFSNEEDRGQTSLFNNECEGMCGV